VASDQEERNKVFGMPRGADPHAEEPQRVLGVPVDWYGPVDWGWLRSVRHPINAYKRWTLRRRLGPYAPDHDEGNPGSPANPLPQRKVSVDHRVCRVPDETDEHGDRR
jgi:hypothetical protein